MPRITLPPYPNGWFAVAHVDELAAGEVRSIHYFGRELVLFRGEDGRPRTLDGYCAHLGAHLATGGRVVGNTLKCPFHSWRFDGESGGCVEIPYAKKIPPKAQAPILIAELMEIGPGLSIPNAILRVAQEIMPMRECLVKPCSFEG